MKDLLIMVANLAVPVFAVSSMLSIGFQFSTKEILMPLRHVSGVIRSSVANFILVPLLTYLLLYFLPVALPLKIGLFLVACAAGAPFLLQLAQLARGDLALSATFLALLLIVTIVYMPIVVPWVLPETNVSAATIAIPLVMTMLLPLAVGHFVEARYRSWAKRLLPVARKISGVALIVLIFSTVLADIDLILGVFGTGAVLVSAIIILGAFAIGFFLGGPRPAARSVIGLGTGQRNIAAATVVAIDGFESPDVLVMVVVFSVVSFAILFPMAWLLRRRMEPREMHGDEQPV